MDWPFLDFQLIFCGKASAHKLRPLLASAIPVANTWNPGIKFFVVNVFADCDRSANFFNPQISSYAIIAGGPDIDTSGPPPGSLRGSSCSY